jgi:hypothetical protein
MDTFKKIASIVIVFLAMCACHEHKRNFIDNLSKCVSSDSNSTAYYDSLIYSFNTNSIDYETINKAIINGARIDTFRFINHDNEQDRILKISDIKSEMKFYWSKKDSANKGYSLFEYSISSNLIRFKNGIYIGMSKKEFFKKLNVTFSDCDSFLLHGNSYFYHFFIFKDNQLKTIERKMPIM